MLDYKKIAENYRKSDKAKEASNYIEKTFSSVVMITGQYAGSYAGVGFDYHGLIVIVDKSIENWEEDVRLIDLMYDCIIVENDIF